MEFVTDPEFLKVDVIVKAEHLIVLEPAVVTRHMMYVVNVEVLESLLENVTVKVMLMDVTMNVEVV